MKKIDTWLDVQRFLTEASVMQEKREHSDVQFLAPLRPRHFHSRRLIKINHYTV